MSDGSTAGYRVDEVLNGADVTLAGTTGQVSGSVVVGSGALSSAEVTVDVATIATDSGRRDAYFRDSVMDVGTNPTATFTVTEPGELTVAGETREVQVDLSVVRTAEGVDISGLIPVTFADHGLEAPNLGFVSVEDQGAIEFLLHLFLLHLAM